MIRLRKLSVLLVGMLSCFVFAASPTKLLAQPTVQTFRARPGFPRRSQPDTAFSFDPHRNRNRVKIFIYPKVSLRVRETIADRTVAEKKMASALIEIADQFSIDSTVEKNNARFQFGNAAFGATSHIAILDNLERINVYLDLSQPSDSSQLGALLEELAGKIHSARYRLGLIQVEIPILSLKALGASSIIRNIRIVEEAFSNSGPVLSEGVSRSRTDVAQNLFSADGSGVTVGVISDDCGSNEGLLYTDILHGELNRDATTNYDSYTGSRTHEGLAMCEIVQDASPGARVWFESGKSSQADFLGSVDDLAQNGAKIIADDLIFEEEAVFEDGTIAKHLDDVAQQNDILFASSANNQGGTSFMGRYKNLIPNSGIFRDSNVYDFGGGNYLFPVLLHHNGSCTLSLHWDDQYGHSSNDFDLYLVTGAGDRIIQASTNTQDGGQDPHESFSFDNPTSSDVLASLVVVRRKISKSDPNPTPRIKITGYEGVSFYYGTPGSSVYGHAAAKSCLAVAAISARGFNYNTIEPYSNQGPTVIVTYPSRVQTLRFKPDLASFDSVTTSVPSWATFAGTSAASPNVAGIAALVRSKFPLLTAQQIGNLLRGGVLDEGLPGPDSVFGTGRLDAFKMFARANSDSLSALAAFTTPIAPIPDGTGSLNSSMRVTPYCSTTTLDSIYVMFTIEGHKQYGDLIASLTAPDGTSRIILNRPPNGSGRSLGRNPNIVLGDNAVVPLESYDPGASEVVGFYAPASLLSSSTGLRGSKLDGIWTLNVSDGALGNTGILREWGLYFKLTPQKLGYLAMRTSGNLPDAAVGTTVCQRDTLFNTGTGPLTITDAILSGEAGSEYQLSGMSLPMTLSPRAQQPFTICCTPNQRGVRNGALAIIGNSGCSSVANGVSLSVNARAACANLSANGVDSIRLCAGSSAAFTYTITNCGDFSSNYVALISGSGAAAYSVVGGPNQPSLSPGASEVISVIYAPQAPGLHAATLSITPSNAATMSSSLIGIASSASIAGADSSVPTVVNSTSPPFAVLILNSGECDWIPGIPTIADSEFTYVSGANNIISANASGTMFFRFKPNSVGEKRTSVTFPNASTISTPPAMLTINGYGYMQSGVHAALEPNRIVLNQNFPNPFNPSTAIDFSIPTTSFVQLDVLDLGGKLLRRLLDQKLSAGDHSILFDAQGLSSGVLEYRLNSDGVILTRQMILAK